MRKPYLCAILNSVFVGLCLVGLCMMDTALRNYLRMRNGFWLTKHPSDAVTGLPNPAIRAGFNNPAQRRRGGTNL